MDPGTIKPLSSPQPTFFQFYLINNRKGAENTRTYDNENITIGRKEYLNHAANMLDYQDETKTNLNSTITPLKKDSEFQFRIDFNNLNNYEFGLLLYSLNMKYDNRKVGFKLGMGKPLGLGSVEVESAAVKLINYEKKYQSLAGDYYANLDSNKSAKFMNMYKAVQVAGEGFNGKFNAVNNSSTAENFQENTDNFLNIGYIKELHLLRLINRDGQQYKVKYPARVDNGELKGFKWFGDEKGNLQQRLFKPDSVGDKTLRW